MLDSGSATVVSRQGHSVIAVIEMHIACHETSCAPQSLDRVPGIDAQVGSGVWQKLSYTHGSRWRNSAGIEAALQVNLSYKIGRRDTGVEGILLGDRNILTSR